MRGLLFFVNSLYNNKYKIVERIITIKHSLNKSVALSQYFNSNGNLVIEVRCIDSKYKDWIHLDFADLIAKFNINNIITGKHIRPCTVWCTQYFDFMTEKYLPIDSSIHRAGFYEIPSKIINYIVQRNLPIIDKKYKNKYKSAVDPKKEYLFFKFTFTDSKGAIVSTNTTSVCMGNLNDNGVQLF